MIGYDYHVFEEGEVFLNGAGRVYRITHIGKLLGNAGAVEAEQLTVRRGKWHVAKPATLVRTSDACLLVEPDCFVNAVRDPSYMRHVHSQLCDPFREQHTQEALDRKREGRARMGMI